MLHTYISHPVHEISKMFHLIRLYIFVSALSQNKNPIKKIAEVLYLKKKVNQTKVNSAIILWKK